MIKLVDYEFESIPRGSVFRFPGSWPYEKFVDLLVVDMPDKNFAHSLVISTGHKAGLTLIRLPIEARSEAGTVGISKSWVLHNWKEWIYPDCSINEVHMIRNYAAPSFTQDNLIK